MLVDVDMRVLYILYEFIVAFRHLSINTKVNLQFFLNVLNSITINGAMVEFFGSKSLVECPCESIMEIKGITIKSWKIKALTRKGHVSWTITRLSTLEVPLYW